MMVLGRKLAGDSRRCRLVAFMTTLREPSDSRATGARTMPAVLLAGALGACAATGGGSDVPVATATAVQPHPGDWKIDRKPDPITGGGANAWVLATRVTPRPGHLPRPAGLQLVCFKSEPVVRLQFKVMVGANRSASFAYRFDERPGHTPKVRFLADRSTVVIEDKSEVAKFVTELAGAETLVVSIDSLIFGKTNAAFPVRGAPAAVAAAFAQCPLPGNKRSADGGFLLGRDEKV